MKKFISFRLLAVVLIFGLQFFCNGCEEVLIYEGEDWHLGALRVSDIDGNRYNTVRIGDQWWMTENLKTTRYRNGDSIGTTNQSTLNISGEIEPKYQWAYNGDENSVDTIGRYYTWYVINDSRNVCPTGWHVPSDEEWTTLSNYLTDNGYGYEDSGDDIAKSMAANSDWRTDAVPGNVGNDILSNNSSGFNATPDGYRRIDGKFIRYSEFTGWWSSTESNESSAWYRSISFNLNNVSMASDNKKYGASIRCVRD